MGLLCLYMIAQIIAADNTARSPFPYIVACAPGCEERDIRKTHIIIIIIIIILDPIIGRCMLRGSRARVVAVSGEERRDDDKRGKAVKHISEEAEGSEAWTLTKYDGKGFPLDAHTYTNLPGEGVYVSMRLGEMVCPTPSN